MKTPIIPTPQEILDIINDYDEKMAEEHLPPILEMMVSELFRKAHHLANSQWGGAFHFYLERDAPHGMFFQKHIHVIAQHFEDANWFVEVKPIGRYNDDTLSGIRLHPRKPKERELEADSTSNRITSNGGKR